MEHNTLNKYRNVFYQPGAEPVFCYRTGLTVYEETFRSGALMASGWNSAGYPLNVLTNYPTRLNTGAFAEPQSFNLEIDGQYADFGLEFVDFTQEDTELYLHAIVTLRSRHLPLTIKVHTYLDGSPAFARCLEIINTGDNAMAVSRLSVMSGGLEIMNGANLSAGRSIDQYYSLGYMDSSDGNMEGDFSWHKLMPDETSFNGRFTRSRHRHPMFMLKNNVMGTTLFAQLAWSAGYNFSFDYNAHPLSHDTCLSFKMSIDSYKPLLVLTPGQAYVTPKVHIGIVSGGQDEAVNGMNEHLRKSVLTFAKSNCTVGAGMGPEHDMSRETTMRFMDQMAAIGCEVFIIDAGWYCPPNRVGEWWGRAGDWDFDSDRYPDGIAQMRDYAHSKGMKFGMWMEVERIGHMSKMFELHRDWFTFRINGNCSEGLLNFAIPEAAAWAEEQAAHVISDYKLDLFRVDYNVLHFEWFHVGENSGLRECFSVRHVEGVYKMYHNLKKRFPDVVFENCAGGGGRSDLGMVANFNHSWVSDNQTAPRSLYITNGMTMALPPERVDRLVAGMGCHAYASLDFQMRNAMFGHISMNVFSPAAAEFNPQQLEFISHSLDIYKNFIRSFLPVCNIFHHTPDTRAMQSDGWGVLEIASPDSHKASIGIFTLPCAKSDDIVVFPRGLDPALTYKVTFDNSRTCSSISGFTLINEGLRIRIPSQMSSELVLFDAF